MRRLIAPILFLLIAPAVTATALYANAASADDTPQPRVVVVDQTGGSWAGVARAAKSWDASEHVTVTVARKCDPAAYCVVFQHPAEYDRDWLGWWQPVARHVSTVQLNLSHEGAGVPLAQRWVVCHELGHALGIEHERGDRGSACMRDDYKRPDLPTTATQQDHRMLDRVAQSQAIEGSALDYYGELAS